VLTSSAGVLAAGGNSAWASNSYHSSFGLDGDVMWQVDSLAITDLQDARGQI
jgi:hypothetical protein